MFQEQLKALNESSVRGMVEDILHDVALAANQLEHDLDDHVFDNAVHDPNLASIFLDLAKLYLMSQNREISENLFSC